MSDVERLDSLLDKALFPPSAQGSQCLIFPIDHPVSLVKTLGSVLLWRDGGVREYKIQDYCHLRFCLVSL